MSQTNNIPALLGEALLGAIRQAVREEFQNLMGQNGQQNRRSVEAANPYLTVKEAANLSRLGSPLGAERAREILESILTDKAYERADQH